MPALTVRREDLHVGGNLVFVQSMDRYRDHFDGSRKTAAEVAHGRRRLGSVGTRWRTRR